jgi:trimethylamine--corrinoid protein Co-methyltransferase
MSTVRPGICCLTREQCTFVHEHSANILSEIGIRVDSAAARALFTKAGCRATPDDRIRIPAEQIQWAIDQAPGSVIIYARQANEDEPAFTLGKQADRSTRFGMGVTNLYWQDPDTEAIVPFSIDHVTVAARLAQRLPQFDLLATPGVAQDISPNTADLQVTLQMMANTTKPLVVLVSELDRFGPVLDLLDHLGGDNLAKRPFAIPYVNPISPLVLDEATILKMRLAIDRGVPIIYNNYGMSGATAPITPAGTLALLNAELLGGLVFSQLIKTGTPIILGCLPALFDMRGMHSRYTAQTMLLNLACAEMMAYYELPHSGTSGSGPGWGADLTVAGGFWMNHMTSLIGKVDLAPFVGGNFDSLVFSPAAVVVADEVIRLSRQFAAGFDLEDAAVGRDEIAAVGPGGNFLTAGLTRAHFRETIDDNAIWPAMTLAQWQAKGSPAADRTLKQHVRRLLDEATPPSDHDVLMDRGQQFIDRLKGGNA